ncbi:MAG: right-handed parallel beta-helix repeat-containing protein [Myxococcales bacterium]
MAALQPGHQTIVFAGPTQARIRSAVATGDDVDGVTIAGRAGVVLDGAQAGGSTDCLVARGAGVRVLHVEIRGCPQFAVQFSGPDGLLAHSVIRGNARGVQVRGSGTRIGPDNALAANGTPGIQLATSATIEGNLLAQNEVGILVLSGSGGSEIARNVVRSSTSDGVRTGPGVLDVRVWHNTVIGSGGAGLYLGTNNGGLDVRNNAFVLNSAGGVSGPQQSFSHLSHNAYVQGTGAACVGGCAPGEGALFTAAFVDRDGGDLRPAPGSPLVDAGASLGIDVNGPRPGHFNGSAPDIGAAEASP